MPIYTFECPACGPFTAIRSMKDGARPLGCPECGALSERALATPMLRGGQREDGGSGGGVTLHPGGCACCRPKSRGFGAHRV